ncbi:MAG: AraC family transcriptional regulator [Oceanospirillaceae bacterium]
MKAMKMHSLSKSAAFDFVEMRSASHSNSCYSTHSHDEFSFGVVDDGQAVYKNRKNTHKIASQTLVTINPGDAHSCNPQSENWSYRMLFIETAWMAKIQQEICPPSSYDYSPFEQNLLNNRACYHAFNHLYQMLSTQKNPLTAESLLIEYCAQLFNPVLIHQEVRMGNISLVQELIMDKLGSNIALHDFCKLTDLSPFHLIRSFKQRFGQSPHAYQLDQRIKRARTMLKSGASLASTAHDLGFADQSHFQRNFKKRTALTPRQYQQFFISDGLSKA